MNDIIETNEKPIQSILTFLYIFLVERHKSFLYIYILLEIIIIITIAFKIFIRKPYLVDPFFLTNRR